MMTVRMNIANGLNVKTMTKSEFASKIKEVFATLTPQEKEHAKSVGKQIHNFMSWTHCHHCGRSNHRYFDTLREEGPRQDRADTL